MVLMLWLDTPLLQHNRCKRTLIFSYGSLYLNRNYLTPEPQQTVDIISTNKRPSRWHMRASDDFAFCLSVLHNQGARLGSPPSGNEPWSS